MRSAEDRTGLGVSTGDTVWGLEEATTTTVDSHEFCSGNAPKMNYNLSSAVEGRGLASRNGQPNIYVL